MRGGLAVASGPSGALRPRRPKGSGGITWITKKGAWRITVRHEGKTVARLVEGTYGTAERELKRWVKQLTDGTAQPITVAEWVRERTNARVGISTNAETQDLTLGRLRKWEESPQGNVLLSEMTIGHWEKFVPWALSHGWGTKTLRNFGLQLRSDLARAFDLGNLGLRQNVAALMVLPKQPKPAPQFFHQEELPALFSAFRGRLRDAVVISVATGMRQGELCALSIDHVFLDGTQPRVWVAQHLNRARSTVPRTKKQRNREVQLSPIGVAALRRLIGGRREGLVFPAPGGGAWTSKALLRQYYKDLEAAGLPRHTWHALRHTAATAMLRGGVPLPVVATELGDGDDVVLRTYAHVDARRPPETTALTHALYQGIFPRIPKGTGGEATVAELLASD